MTVDPRPRGRPDELDDSRRGPSPRAAAGRADGSAAGSRRPGACGQDGDRLNPKYTFDNFVIGSSNRFAHAAAVAVAEAPGKSYNPLMIYGQSGLGKTHLLHGIGHYVRQYFPQVRVKYVSTEELTNDFINAISENRTVEFRRTYRDIDVLLIDDIQFLESKIQTQEEFFHTFNTLHNAQKQIVMTSDRPPKALEALEPRLRSRFEWGLLTDIQPPDLETRIAILRKKATAENLVATTRGAGVHRQPHPDEHPRTRGRPHPGDRVREPQPAAGRPRAGRGGAEGPDPRGRRGPDHAAADHGPDRELLQRHRRRPVRAPRARTCW